MVRSGISHPINKYDYFNIQITKIILTENSIKNLYRKYSIENYNLSFATWIPNASMQYIQWRSQRR